MTRTTTGTVVAIVALLLLWGYVTVNKKNEQPFSTREGKLQTVIIVLLIIAAFSGGIYGAFTFGPPKREQYILLLILASGPVAALVGFAVAALRNKPDKLARPKHKK